MSKAPVIAASVIRRATFSRAEDQRLACRRAEPGRQGTIPNITPGSKEMGGWSAADIANYLETGFTPEFDSVGGSMVAVQQNMAHLTKEDRAAIAAYLRPSAK